MTFPKYQIPVSGVQTSFQKDNLKPTKFPKYQIPVSGVQTGFSPKYQWAGVKPEIPDSSKWSSNE